MPNINESGRKKLAIIKVGETRQVGQAEVKEFFAKLGEGTGDAPQVKYGVWSSPKSPSTLYEYIKEGTTIDCDVISKKSEKVDPDGNPYWSRKVTQVYVDGKPVEEKKQFGSGYRRDSPDERRSIERQVSAKLAFEFAPDKASSRECLILAEHIYQWIAEGKLPPGDTRKAATAPAVPEAAEPPAKSKDTAQTEQPPPASTVTKESSPPTEIPLTAKVVHSKLKLVVSDDLTPEKLKSIIRVQFGGKGELSWDLVKSLPFAQLTKLNAFLEGKLAPKSEDKDIPF